MPLKQHMIIYISFCGLKVTFKFLYIVLRASNSVCFTNIRSDDEEVITYDFKEDKFFINVEGSSSGEGGYYDFSIKVPESFMKKVRNTFKKEFDNKND